MTKIIKGEFKKIKDVKVEDVPLTCDAPLEVFINEVSRLSGMDDDLFTYEVKVANIPCDSKIDADLEQEADDDMGYDPSDIYWIRGDDEVELTDEESFDDMDEVAEVFRIDTNLFDFETPIEDSYCNGGNLPDAYHIRNSLHYQDLEWYEALEDCELKDEALRNKAIMEGFIIEDDDESRYEQKRRWNIYTNYNDASEINHGDNEREELCEVHELPVCNVRRYMMIKYSFNNDEEYVTVKEDEYDDLTITRKEACQAYQEIFQIMDEGWMIDRLPPIIMVCSGHSRLIATFTFSTGSEVSTSAWRTIWISSDLALSVMIVATLALVRNFIIPCAVDVRMIKIIKGEFEKIKDVKVEDVPLTCDAPLEVFNNEVSRLRGMEDDLFTYEVEVANIPCDSKMDADSEQEADDDMGYDPSDIYWIRGDDEVELTDEESSDDMDEVAEVFRIDTNLFDFETPMCKAFKEFNWREDSYCNGGNLPDAYHIRNSLHYQDLEWYEALKDCELKDEALRNKAIIEGFIIEDDDESRYEQKRRWNIYTNYDDAYEINHGDNEREELCEVHELP
ncbi:hypothetical protein Tco_1244408, partial [Tanacetum coccineum]